MDIKVFKKQGVINVDGTNSDAYFQVEVINLETLLQIKKSLEETSISILTKIKEVQSKIDLITNLEEGKDYIILPEVYATDTITDTTNN